MPPSPVIQGLRQWHGMWHFIQRDETVRFSDEKSTPVVTIDGVHGPSICRASFKALYLSSSGAVIGNLRLGISGGEGNVTMGLSLWRFHSTA
ncbi:hypothetical protein CY34DRAFT_809357 [Suillus luteus UH-Slu-Lm8-n1]|uniref:Uncharacterized protein n=1 Tax=Suillus luteus UH-Slu-Lm8-n1 TaxID=930992 RepID=A0A0D0A9J4_9AGAM|nr:hypothetical protein CY34DRAFT_809357 [Suillus luteus UH-Slu-Lm8-n1]